MRQFIKVGDHVFNIRAINTISLNDPDDVHVFTSDCNGSDTQGYRLDRQEPATQAFITWLTDSERCIDVMNIEPESDASTVIEDASGIRFEV